MQNFVSAPHRGETMGVPGGSPNAALLIDFDNVTMGIRSDLTRQLKELLNSDIIRGKVAVQRAYADWRRYAQYIVPLSEASVDLIFAPAYGSSKKNATDIRLAIDALELVFTRPEIGTYILLSGDSDFSSLVLKLKEYGKYVIGVGLRESASDLLVQNCDEYFSYSSLTGLTKAGEEDTVGAFDPWDLVERSVNRMADENDVMRSDRLKQVMLDLDPNFDEGEIGYSKFNKFLAEAASRNRLALRKLGNGQYEVQPIADGQTAAKEEPKRPRRDRDEDRGRSRKRPEPPKELKAEREREREPRRESKPAPRPKPEPKTRERRAEDLDHGYELLKRAVRELIDGPGGAARDSDIKRKMLELEPGWDESELGFTKFSRFLRQAHDAEVVDLQRTSEGYYEARLPSGAGSSGPKREHRTAKPEARSQATEKAPAPKAEEKPARQREEREQRRERSEKATQATPAAEKAAEPESRKPEPKKEAPKAEAPKAEARPDEPKPETKPEEPKAEVSKPKAEPEAEEPAKEAPPEQASPAAKSSSFGRGMRRGKKAEGPPPLLPGQAVGSGAKAAGDSGTAKADRQKAPASKSEASKTEASKPEASKPEAGPSESAQAEPAKSEPAKSEAVKTPETTAEARPPAEPAPEPTQEKESGPKASVGTPEFDPEELGLPTDEGAVIRYLSNSYQGVGQKTAEALIEAFGEDRVFNGLNSSPEKVREVLGSGRRTEILLDAWQRDYRRRTQAGSGDAQA